MARKERKRMKDRVKAVVTKTEIFFLNLWDEHKGWVIFGALGLLYAFCSLAV